jgi:FSR family fosmidomycin resistance protein-like MFS transporter
MARWMFAGSLGSLAGPILLAGGSILSFSWRVAFAAIALFSAALLALAWRQVPSTASSHEDGRTLWSGLRATLLALRRREVVRWLLLLECADLMMDVLLGYLALYFTDRVGVPAASASLSIAVWTAAELLGSLALIPLLERVQGSRYLRLSAVLELGLFPAFLLVPGVLPKLALLALVGFVNAGWYPVLQGRLYSAMPGQSGTVVSLGAVTGLIHLLPPLALAAVAQRYNLGVALWLIVLSPLGLLVGLPRRETVPAGAVGEEAVP